MPAIGSRLDCGCCVRCARSAVDRTDRVSVSPLVLQRLASGRTGRLARAAAATWSRATSGAEVAGNVVGLGLPPMSSKTLVLNPRRGRTGSEPGPSDAGSRAPHPIAWPSRNRLACSPRAGRRSLIADGRPRRQNRTAAWPSVRKPHDGKVAGWPGRKGGLRRSRHCRLSRSERPTSDARDGGDVPERGQGFGLTTFPAGACLVPKTDVLHGPLGDTHSPIGLRIGSRSHASTSPFAYDEGSP